MSREVFDFQSAKGVRIKTGVAIGGRYDLATALLVVRKMETSASRQAVFNEIKGKNRLFRLVDEFYSKLGSRMLQPLVLFLYVLKSVTSLGSTDKQSSCAIAVVNFGNEEKAIARVAALVPDMPVRRSRLSGAICSWLARLVPF